MAKGMESYVGTYVESSPISLSDHNNKIIYIYIYIFQQKKVLVGMLLVFQIVVALGIILFYFLKIYKKKILNKIL